MSNEASAPAVRADIGQKIVYWLALALVIVGMLNAMPGIPGVDDVFSGFMGFKDFTIRKYPYEYFYPIAFAVMMIIVALKHSLWRELANSTPLRRRLGLMMDVALVIGANDIVNPAARDDPESPLYGMPVLDVDQAKRVIVVKRGDGTGYAGVENPLLFSPVTRVLFGDARDAVQDLIMAIKGLD